MKIRSVGESQIIADRLQSSHRLSLLACVASRWRLRFLSRRRRFMATPACSWIWRTGWAARNALSAAMARCNDMLMLALSKRGFLPHDGPDVWCRSDHLLDQRLTPFLD
jgi:hypothetical protein